VKQRARTRLAMTAAALVLPLAAGGAMLTRGAAADEAGVAASKVKLVFQTVPVVKARVMWGRKLLGVIAGPRRPLVIERPRDSGPLDVVVRADGYLPVHTRAYTFTDGKVSVKLTPVGEKQTLFGYKQELPADAGTAPDAGAPDR